MAALLTLGVETSGRLAHAADSKKRAHSVKPASLIEPGVGIGPLKLGDTRERALRLFPRKPNIDEEDDSGDCGTAYNGVDLEETRKGRIGVGNVLIRFEDGRVSQIESATPRYHTAQGLTFHDPPEEVGRYYKNLRAYVLMSAPIRALGDRPLIFWLDARKGIAFALAYSEEAHRRNLYKIIVFKPNSKFCPEDETTSSPNWREIAPYSLEPPDSLARNSTRQSSTVRWLLPSPALPLHCRRYFQH
jgi:hypothetical protein